MKLICIRAGKQSHGSEAQVWIADYGFEISQDRVTQSRRWKLKLHSCFTRLTGWHQTPFNLKSEILKRLQSRQGVNSLNIRAKVVANGKEEAYYRLTEKRCALARIFHESPAATTKLGTACGTERSAASANNMAVLPGVLGCLTLRRTVQVRLGFNTLWLPGGTTIFMVSPLPFMKHSG